MVPCLPSVELGPSQHSHDDLVRILQRFGKGKDKTQALHLHAYMRKNGLDTHMTLGNYLVPMLVDAGTLHHAQQAFDKLVHRNEWSWNSIINGYLKCRKPSYVLSLYETMQADTSTQPTGHTYVAALKACAMLRDIQTGEGIHRDISKSGLLQQNLFVGNTLIDMYAKCGSLTKAQNVFDSLLTRGVVSYNALITGYVENGCGEGAIECFERMQIENVPPNAVTLISSLRSCGLLKDSIKGQEIHVEVEIQGLMKRELLIGTTLVDMYAKCGLLEKAWKVFEKLPIRDVVSWTALITGYVEHGRGIQAVQYLEQMFMEGISPNSVTFVSCLKACASLGDMDKAIEMHAEMERMGIVGSELLVGTTLIDLYCKCGAVAKAQQVFDKLPVHDIVCWNALISGYVEQGYGDKAIECFEQMSTDTVSPDAVTFICSLRACTSTGNIEKGQEIHTEIENQGFLERSLEIGNVLIDMYAKCGLLVKARNVFDKLPIQDVVSWTALISGYVDHDHSDEAVDYFEEMQWRGICPNAVTFICSLKACGNIGAAEKGCKIHAEIERRGLVERDPTVGTSLVDMYAKCGDVNKAQQVFENLPIRDGISWTALMAGYAQIGQSHNVFYAYDKMLEEGTRPNLVTFIVLLSACSRACLLHKCQSYFEAMSKDYGILPTLEHHTCMVNLLGRIGHFDKAVTMIKKMPFSPDIVIWHSILGACKRLGHLDFGNEVFKQAVRPSM